MIFPSNFSDGTNVQNVSCHRRRHTRTACFDAMHTPSIPVAASLAHHQVRGGLASSAPCCLLASADLDIIALVASRRSASYDFTLVTGALGRWGHSTVLDTIAKRADCEYAACGFRKWLIFAYLDYHNPARLYRRILYVSFVYDK